MNETTTGITGSPAAEPAGQTASGETTAPPAAGEDKRQAFRALVEGEYKEQYTEMFQNAFNRRFREMKGMESRLAQQQPLLELLSRHYGSDDLRQLHAALERDLDSRKPPAAADAGEQRRRMAGEQLRRWLREAGETGSRYPAFDLRAELTDGEFRRLLRSGVGVRQAYELRHMEEITTAAARAAARSAGEQMAQRIRSRGIRPRENGISAQSAAVTGSGVHSLTPAQRRDIARRVQRGDTVRF